MDESQLRSVLRYLRSNYPAPSEAYAEIADVLEALYTRNEALQDRVQKLELNARTREWK